MYLYCGNPTNALAMVSLTDPRVNTARCVVHPHRSDFDAQNIKYPNESLGILKT